MAAQLELVGREKELSQIRACLTAKRNVLLEGPVGVGKTHLALAVTRELKRRVFRVDGDNRYSEQKLSGWFDPPTVIKKGYVADAFIPGPLVEAMREGGILFINELNRLPESVQNVLLPAIDERIILVPRLGEIKAKEGFLVVATQNPQEFVATSHLSEAILDRFELVVLDYQTEEEELEIVSSRMNGAKSGKGSQLPLASVRLARMTREHPRIKRGASIRAALSVAEIGAALMKAGASFEEAFVAAAIMALPTRIEIEREAESSLSPRTEAEQLLKEWAQSVLDELGGGEKVKKKA
ncbi:MAG TPA: MoxR family ATPase [Bdellovibrionota bacterium]|nr:MoxR family ATPase [Bdellovibrionota bacterium]